MIYAKTVTASSGGSAASPNDAELTVTNGLIYQFDLYFPPGSSGLLNVRIADGGFPVWPSEPGEWFYGDNSLISFPDRYYIASPSHKFKIWYYNLDDTYDHKFTVRIGQVLAEEFIGSFLPQKSTENLGELIKELIEGQKKEDEARLHLISEYFGTVEREPLPSER